MPVNIASKIVGSNLRDWGQSVKLNKMGLTRKYKLAQSFRGWTFGQFLIKIKSSEFFHSTKEAINIDFV